NFSALLRQPGKISRKEKLAYVDEVIKLLDMEEYADAVVGVPGEGLNVEQRKRLTVRLFACFYVSSIRSLNRKVDCLLTFPRSELNLLPSRPCCSSSTNR